jgi:hypothetical protein
VTGPSSQPTGLLELGRALAEELNVDNGVDTLGRWMAHYLAEQLQLLEQTSGANKARVETRVAKLIIQIWQHRGALPEHAYPLHAFGKVAAALAGIAAGRKANSKWRRPPNAPQVASLTLKCFEQASFLATLGVFELLPSSAPEIPEAVKNFLDSDERAFLDGIDQIYSAAAELLPRDTEIPSVAETEQLRRAQLEVIDSLESALVALRSAVEARVEATPGVANCSSRKG